jgi:hypothetical protein
MKVITEKINRMFASRRFNLIAFFFIAALILVAYSNTFYASFHFDDNPSIVENPYIKRVTLDNIKHLLSINRPVVNLTLMLNYSLGGLNVVGWHIFNIGCHIANSYFVYLLILWTLNTPLLARQYAEKARRMALFGSLLFAVHPIQTESVTYIITRTELLATFFYLGAFLLFIQGAKRNKFAWFIGSACSAFLSAGSKEWAVTLPAVIFLYDFIFLSEGKLKPTVSRWKAYILITLSWIVIARTLNLVAGSGSGASVGFNISNAAGIPLNAWTYLLTSFNVIWTYIRLLVLPINQNLDYEYAVAQTLFAFPALLSFIGHIVVVGTSFWLYKKKGWLLIPFGVAWFYITLSPVQSFVPVLDVIFEHRLYLPSIGFFIVIIAGFESLFDRLDERRSEEASAGITEPRQK